MNEILVTGYGFFSRYYLNTSEAVARSLENMVVKDLHVKSIVLPVSLKYVRKNLPEILLKLRPRLIIGLGLHPGANEVILELASYNTAFYTRPDVDGHKAWLEKIVEDGEDVLQTKLPVKEIVNECRRERGLPLKPGLSMGIWFSK